MCWSSDDSEMTTQSPARVTGRGTLFISTVLASVQKFLSEQYLAKHPWLPVRPPSSMFFGFKWFAGVPLKQVLRGDRSTLSRSPTASRNSMTSPRQGSSEELVEDTPRRRVQFLGRLVLLFCAFFAVVAGIMVLLASERA